MDREKKRRRQSAHHFPSHFSHKRPMAARVSQRVRVWLVREGRYAPIPGWRLHMIRSANAVRMWRMEGEDEDEPGWCLDMVVGGQGGMGWPATPPLEVPTVEGALSQQHRGVAGGR